jgi:hypothetical protein
MVTGRFAVGSDIRLAVASRSAWGWGGGPWVEGRNARPNRHAS